MLDKLTLRFEHRRSIRGDDGAAFLCKAERRYEDGSLALRICQHRDQWLLEFPGQESYRYDPSTGVVHVLSRGDITPGASRAHIEKFVRPFVLDQRGFGVLHASGVLSDQGVVALCGDSGAGKSTIAFALESAGYPGWADDSVVFSRGASDVVSYRLPFRYRLRPHVARYFGLPPSRGKVAAAPKSAAMLEKPLCSVYVLEPRDSVDTGCRVSRIRSMDALVSTMQHGCHAGLDSTGHRREILLQYLALITGAGVFKVSFARGPKDFEQVAEAIRAKIEQGGRKAA